MRASGSTGTMAASLPFPLLCWWQFPSDLIHSLCLGKKSLVSHLPAAFLLHANLKVLKLLLISSLSAFTGPTSWHDSQSTTSSERVNGRNCQSNIFQINFPSHLRSHKSRHLFKRPICHSVFSKHHRSPSLRFVRLEPPVSSCCCASDVWFHSAPYRRRRTPKQLTFPSEVFY